MDTLQSARADLRFGERCGLVSNQENMVVRVHLTANKAAAEVRAKVLRKMNELQGLGKPQTRFNLQKQWEALRTYIKGDGYARFSQAWRSWKTVNSEALRVQRNMLRDELDRLSVKLLRKPTKRIANVSEHKIRGDKHADPKKQPRG